MTAAVSRPGPAETLTAPPMPSTVRIGLSRALVDVKAYCREIQAVVFTLALPVMLMVIFGAIFTGKVPGTGVDFRQYFISGILASGIVSTAFVGIGVGIAGERADGTLKRLHGTPMPPASYFIGKMIIALILALGETVLLFAVGVALYGLALPSSPERWLTLVWVVGLGVVTCTLLGVAVSGLPRSDRSATAVFNLPYLALQFVSGVFFSFADLPSGIQRIAALFPLKWLCQGLRSALLPDAQLAAEPAHAWEHGRVALVLAAWSVAGLALCMTTFRWTRRSDG